MPPQTSLTRTGPLGQITEGIGDALQGFIIIDTLAEQKKERNSKTILAGIEAFKSGNTDLALSIFQGAGRQGRAITDHFLAGPEGSITPLDDVSGAALTELFNIKQGRELAIEELIARGPQEVRPVEGPLRKRPVLIGEKVRFAGPEEKRKFIQDPDVSIQRQVQTRAGREDIGIEGFIEGPQSPRAKLLRSIQATQDTELTRARETAAEGRKVAVEARARRAEPFGQRLSEIQERRAQGQLELAAQRERRLTVAQNNAVKMAIADQRAAQSIATLKATKDRVSEQKEFFSQIAKDADTNKVLNNAQVRAGVIPTQNATASSMRQELNRIAAIHGIAQRFGVVPGPPGISTSVSLSIQEGALTPELQRAVAAEFPQNAQAAIRAFNKTIESVRATEFSRKALGDQRALRQISAVLSAVKGRPPSERQVEIDRILELLAAATGLPINTLSADSGKGKSVRQFLNDFIEGAGFAGLPLGGIPALISGISNILFDGQKAPTPVASLPTVTAPERQPISSAPRPAPATARQIEDDLTLFD